MPTINYGTPPGGGFNVDVPGNAGYGVPGGGGMPGGMDLSWMMNLAAQSAKNKIAKQQLDMQQQRQGMGQVAEDSRYQRYMRSRVPHQMQQARLDQQKQGTAMEMQRRNAPTQALAPFHASLQYANRIENPLDRMHSGNSNLGSNFRNAPFAGALIGTQMPDNKWEDLYKTAAASGAESENQAGQNLRQMNNQNFVSGMEETARREAQLRFLRGQPEPPQQGRG